MRLLLYIRISTDNLELPPAFIQQMRSERITLADIDNQSTKEVIDITCRAIKESEKCGVLVDIKNQDAPVEKLYPIFKALALRSQNVRWYQNAHSTSLERFRSRVSGQVLELQISGPIILSFLTE